MARTTLNMEHSQAIGKADYQMQFGFCKRTLSRLNSVQPTTPQRLTFQSFSKQGECKVFFPMALSTRYEIPNTWPAAWSGSPSPPYKSSRCFLCCSGEPQIGAGWPKLLIRTWKCWRLVCCFLFDSAWGLPCFQTPLPRSPQEPRSSRSAFPAPTVHNLVATAPALVPHLILPFWFWFCRKTKSD